MRFFLDSRLDGWMCFDLDLRMPAELINSIQFNSIQFNSIQFNSIQLKPKQKQTPQKTQKTNNNKKTVVIKYKIISSRQ